MRKAGLCAVLLASICLAAGDLQLINAVRDRNRTAVLSLLDEHADVNQAQPDGATALAWAAYLDEEAIADALLKAGARVNTADEYGETPLTLACANGNASLVRKLLDAGANADAARWDDETALMIASRSGSVDAVKFLLGKGAKVDAVESRKGQTALMWAAAEGHSDVVDLLLKNGADPNAASKQGFAPLTFAAEKGDGKTVLALLAARADVNHAIATGQTALEFALISDKSDVANILLDRGASVNAVDGEGVTPLHAAAHAGNVELVKKLLARGANPNARTSRVAIAARPAGSGFFRRSSGELTPLHVAARANHADVMRELVAAGADPKLKAQDGTTLLISAAACGHIEAVRYTWDLDPEVNAVNQNGSTAAHAAVSAFHSAEESDIVEVVRFLAKHGARLDVKDSRGRTPMMIASAIPLDDVRAALTKLIAQNRRTAPSPSAPAGK